MVGENFTTRIFGIYCLYYSAMEAHYVSKNLLREMEVEIDGVASVLAYFEEIEPDNSYASNTNREIEEMYKQMEYVHRTGRPALGIDWETYEMDELHTEYKVKYEDLMEDPEYYYNEIFKLFKN